jgi:hypothetical protein
MKESTAKRTEKQEIQQSWKSPRKLFLEHHNHKEGIQIITSLISWSY